MTNRLKPVKLQVTRTSATIVKPPDNLARIYLPPPCQSNLYYDAHVKNRDPRADLELVPVLSSKRGNNGACKTTALAEHVVMLNAEDEDGNVYECL